MTWMFLLDLKQAPGIFLDYLSVLYGWKYFHVYFITHCYTVFAWIWIGTTHLLVVAILVPYPFLNGLVVPFVSVEILFNKIAMYSNKPILRIISSKSALKQILKWNAGDDLKKVMGVALMIKGKNLF